MVKCGNSAQCSAAKQKLRQLQLFYEFAEHNRRRWRRYRNPSTLQSLSPSQSTSLPASGTSFCKESVNLMSSSGSSKPHFWGTHCTLYNVHRVWCVQRVACAVIATSCSNRKQKTSCKHRQTASGGGQRRLSTRSSHHNFSQGTTVASVSLVKLPRGGRGACNTTHTEHAVMMHLADYEARKKPRAALGLPLLLQNQFANAELERSCNFCGHLERRARTVACHSSAGGVANCSCLCV